MMKKFTLPLVLFLSMALGSKAQEVTTCPAPNPDDAECYQTNRTTTSAVLPVPNNNPLWQWPPLPNQDCCNAIPLCRTVNTIDNGVIIPEGGPGTAPFFPGCVPNELPPDGPNNCFNNNEKGTTWYKFQIRPLPNGPTAAGSPAGKLRFRIIPLDAFDDPDYDPFNDLGNIGYGDTDYDFLLFKIPPTAVDDGAACTRIRNSSGFGNANSVIASCNWTGVRGPTGLFEPGEGTAMSQGAAARFNKPLDVRVGDLFYLAIDNFSVNLQGFQVDFRGLEENDSTAIVNPPATDTIRFAGVKNPECADKKFILTFDHSVLCDSVKPEKFTLIGIPGGQMVTIEPLGGCNPGGQDSSFVFTISPYIDGTTFSLLVTSEIKDICGNKVLADTANFKIRALEPLIFGIEGSQPSCGITKIRINFANDIPVDSLKNSKFKVLFAGNPFASIIKIERANGGPMVAGQLDTSFVLTFNRAIKDSLNLSLALTGLIRDKCNNPVELDSIRFRINPFLKAKAVPEVVCPNIPTTLTAILDSTFQNYSDDSLSIEWYNLGSNEVLVDDANTTFINPKTVKVERDNPEAENTIFRVVVRNLINGCRDTSEIPMRFSPSPRMDEAITQTVCFNQTEVFKPSFSNAKASELKFAWFRKGNLNDTLSTDSSFSQFNTDTSLAKGLEQTFVLRTQYLDSLGGCKAQTEEIKFRFGRKIEPIISLDSLLRYASITPAEFTFGNATKFTPPKAMGRFDWTSGLSGSLVTTEGAPSSVNFTYNEPSNGNEGYTVSLTAFDSLYINPAQVGKVCKNSSEIKVYVQNLIPSLVTANGDGANDNFFIKGMRPNTFTMKLYNRWGKVVAEQDPFLVEGWNPIEKVKPGIYYYILTEKRTGKTLVSWLTITEEK